jgi:hypothetical protein
MVKTGSFWTSGNNRLFEVVSVAATGDETWVTYKDLSSGSHYSCLIDAFVSKFRSFTNHQYA